MLKKSKYHVLLMLFLLFAVPLLLLTTVNAEAPADQAFLSAAASESPALADAVDNNELVFETGGDAEWVLENTRFIYGGDAAQSGDISDNQESWMRTEVTGPGTIDFYWKTASQLGADFLEFFIDGARKDYLSGSGPWTRQTYLVPAGTHTLTWRYKKNFHFDGGLDTAWVDKVTWTTYSVVPEVPGAPTGVSASDGIYDYKVHVTWRSVNGATSYTIYRSESPTSARIFITARSGTSFDDASALCDTKYYYWIRAKNSVGTSGYSNYNSGYIEFTAPSGVFASDGTYPDKISVTWNLSSAATSYEIYRSNSLDGAKIKLATTSQTTFDDKTAACCDDYYYWIKAKNSKCTTGFSNPDTGYLQPPPPPAPTGVSASDGTFAGEIRVTWNASSSIDIYEVYRSNLPDGVKTMVASTSSTSWNDTDVPCGVFYYWIKAKNSTGTSDYSNYDSGYDTMCPPPAPPAGVSASDGLYTDKIHVSWKASPGATSYQIYRADTFGGDKFIIGTATGTAYDDYLANVVQKYYYWVKALNSTTAGDLSLNFDTGYRLCPNAPTGLKASDDMYTDKILVTWNSSKGATSYQLYRATYPATLASARTLIATTSGTSYTDMVNPCVGCSKCTPKYFYWVKAISPDCTSGFSNYDSGYVHCSPLPPPDITATDGTLQNVVQITWTLSTGDYQFKLYRSTSLDGAKTLIATTSNALYLDKNITCSTSYYYWLQRVDKKGFVSDFSNPDEGYCSGNEP